MKRWWCMDCRVPVELNKHGRCESCESEAVYSNPSHSPKHAASVQPDTMNDAVCA
jgi:hypothetical protein